jgi:hypothetical protein
MSTHSIFTKYLSPTNYRGARIRAKFGFGGGAISIAFQHELNGAAAHELAAHALIDKYNPDLLLIESADLIGGYVFIAAHKKHYA